MNQLKLELDETVPTATLRALHRIGWETPDAQPVAALLQSAGVQRLNPVFELSDEEIADDKYGFARQFKLVLADHVDVHTSLEAFRRSPLVKTVRPVLLRRQLEDGDR